MEIREMEEILQPEGFACLQDECLEWELDEIDFSILHEEKPEILN